MTATAGVTLRLAAIYNVLFGAICVLAPDWWFSIASLEPQRYPMLWQCIGMIVGVYGIGYWLAARDPARHWPIVLVGLLGKVLGPIGFLQAGLTDQLPWRCGWLIVTNDLIWWVPFASILLAARRAHRN
jgi:small multidrug resistance pump